MRMRLSWPPLTSYPCEIQYHNGVAPLKTYFFKAVCAFLVLHTCAIGQEHTRLSIAEAARLAVENHPFTRQADAAVTASKGRFWRGISPPPPGVNLEYSYVPVGHSLNNFGEKTIEVSQEIEFPLTTIARGTGLSREVDARQGDLASVRLGVAAAARLAYIQTLAAERRLALARENLAIASSFLKDADTRKSVGEGTHLELLTARVQQTQAANALEIARAAVFTVRTELRTALGLGQDRTADSLVLTDSLAYEPISLSLDSLQDRAQKANPQIAASESRVGSAEAERTAAWMSLLPSLNFAYYRQTVGDNANLYGARFGISVPLWFLLDNRGQVQEASAQVASASEVLRSTKNSISLEVASAFTAYANGKRQVELQQREMVPQAEEAFRVASVSYHAGEASYVEFLQALQGLNTARHAALDALVEYNAALIRLERTVGRAL